MQAAFSLVLGLLLAAPALAQTETAPRGDVIELRNGSKLEGRILAEDDTSLTIEILTTYESQALSGEVPFNEVVVAEVKFWGTAAG